jgi:pimeloyl-ACP methyl ester carboxylesterase
MSPLSRRPCPRRSQARRPRLAVFAHGLGGTEGTWLFAARRRYDDPAMCYRSKLADEFGYTALYVRYNTGLHVSENGRLFSDLLSAVVANWPTAVEEIALIGHSMGGLIARSACHGGQQAGASWVPAVRHVVCLGSPHVGAPSEKGVAVLSRALAGVAETRPFASLLNERSAWHQRPPSRLPDRGRLARLRSLLVPPGLPQPDLAAPEREPLCRRRHRHSRPFASGRPRSRRRSPPAGQCPWREHRRPSYPVPCREPKTIRRAAPPSPAQPFGHLRSDTPLARSPAWDRRDDLGRRTDAVVGSGVR